MTSSGRFADIVLPVCTQFETWGIEDGWKYGDELIMMPKLVEPAYESKSDYHICSGLADKLGIGKEFTQERNDREWMEWCVETYREGRFPDIPTFEELESSNAGVYSVPVTDPFVAFKDFRADPEKYPLDTPSGKIEIFSQALFEKGKPDVAPPVPKYIEEEEGAFGTKAEKYPLMAMGHHAMQRAHSSHANNDWLREAFPQRVFINTIDAEARNIKNGDKVKVFNERGTMIIKCKVTGRILPGLIDIPQGAWYDPDKNGVDRGGCVNVLSSEKWTPWTYSNSLHTILVQVEKVKGGIFKW